MNSWYNLTQNERAVLLRETAHEEHLSDFAIEKDWWVTMALKALFMTHARPYLLFKGGTSLSKGWNLIQRFSEDIDLSLNNRYLMENISSNSQLLKLRKLSRGYITGDLVADLDQQLKALGLSDYHLEPVMQVNGTDIDGDKDPTVILLRYPSIAERQSPYIRPYVKIEISCLSMAEPLEPRTLTSYINTHYPDVDADAKGEIPVVLPTRTFLEKIFLLCEEFQRENPRTLRMSRHMYDLDRLMQSPFAAKALSDKELYCHIVEHRRKFYHLKYVDYDKNYPDRISIIPPKHILNEWKADYENLLYSFVFGEKRPFEQVMENMRLLEGQIKSLGWRKCDCG